MLLTQLCSIMTFVAQQLKHIRQELLNHVTLVAVSKTHPVELIMQAYEAGQRHFGENRVQEMVAKHAEMPKDIYWHLIGHLQRNKVGEIAPFVHLIHGIDSERLLLEVDKQATLHHRIIDVLLQFHIATEETKFGFELEEAETMLRSEQIHHLANVRIVGVMGMASFTNNALQVRQEFRQLKGIYDSLKQHFFSNQSHFSTLSMGMSGDYELAVEEGSTMVRVGSAIFGQRE
jgi:pyridoxal phosphate enzyme (YggS family)